MRAWLAPRDISLLARARDYLRASLRPGQQRIMPRELKRLQRDARDWILVGSDALKDHVLVRISKGQLALLRLLGACAARAPKTNRLCASSAVCRVTRPA